jgi:hypothetical protein
VKKFADTRSNDAGVCLQSLELTLDPGADSMRGTDRRLDFLDLWGNMGGWWGSNPRHPESQSGATTD